MALVLLMLCTAVTAKKKQPKQELWPNGEVMSEWKMQLVRNADRFDFPIHRPYYQLTDEQRRLLWTGNEYFKGVNDFYTGQSLTFQIF